MSSMVHSEGSVVSITPSDDSWLVVWDEGSQGENYKSAVVVGWATVVTLRQSWVITTVVVPLIVCCGQADHTFNHNHGDYAIVRKQQGAKL